MNWWYKNAIFTINKIFIMYKNIFNIRLILLKK